MKTKRIDELENVYFVCTGNTCRSPMAARILHEKLKERGLEHIVVQSRRAPSTYHSASTVVYSSSSPVSSATPPSNPPSTNTVHNDDKHDVSAAAQSKPSKWEPLRRAVDFLTGTNKDDPTPAQSLSQSPSPPSTPSTSIVLYGSDTGVYGDVPHVPKTPPSQMKYKHFDESALASMTLSEQETAINAMMMVQDRAAELNAQHLSPAENSRPATDNPVTDASLVTPESSKVITRREPANTSLSEATTPYSYTGGMMSLGAEKVLLAAYGDDGFVKAHRSRDMKGDELNGACIVIGMEPSHVGNSVKYSLDGVRKVFTLGELVNMPSLKISDPMVGGRKDYACGEARWSDVDNSDFSRGTVKTTVPTNSIDDVPMYIRERFPAVFSPDLLDRYYEYVDTFVLLNVMMDHFLENDTINFPEKRDELSVAIRQLRKTPVVESIERKSRLQQLAEAPSFSATRSAMTQIDRDVEDAVETVARFVDKMDSFAKSSTSKSLSDMTDVFGNAYLNDVLLRGIKRECLTDELYVDRKILYSPLVPLFIRFGKELGERIVGPEGVKFKDAEGLISNMLAIIESFPRPTAEYVCSILEGSQVSALSEPQSSIYDRLGARKEVSATSYGKDSPAYIFTNEPLANLLGKDVKINVSGPVLSITASADMVLVYAGLGAPEIFAVDVSDLANYWGEYKLAAFRDLSHEEFIKKIASHNATWKEFPWDLDVSLQAHDGLAKAADGDKSVWNARKVFQWAGSSSVRYAGYADDPNTYKRLQASAKNALVRFYPQDLNEFFASDGAQTQFASVYLSNALDHLVDPSTGKKDFSVDNMTRCIAPIASRLRDDGQIIFNFQWSERALNGAKKALSNLGYDLQQVSGNAGGCGAMYIANK